MDDLIRSVIAVLAIANPIGAAPIFLSLTDGATPAERRRAALHATIAVLVILTVAALGGRWVLHTFGISFPAFRAAGGLVILLMGLEMLGGSPTHVQHEQGPAAADDAILVPLAMPLIAGPGAITTVITLTTQTGGWRGQANALAAVAVTAAVLYLSLRSAERLAARVSARGQRIFLRFMGLVLVSVGAQLLLTGVRTFLIPGA